MSVLLALLTPSDIAHLRAVASGCVIRSNYNNTEPGPNGDWQLHWHTLEHLINEGLAVRVGRHYGLTAAGQTCLSLRSTRIARANHAGIR